ncbi:CobW family GTP-binding protein [Pseudogracilibacillus sp. SO30301A]|uniref:CobW family GTP-binding protein n=1 Tax=Pseudogracilibacillus sp. SO30301A TaxID=3098291 RepID=UPI00300E125D
MIRNKIPITILTGFLGAGKTTLLNRILKDNSNENAAVIVNEFGDLSIDSALIMNTKEEIIEINSGCICCNVRGDLISILSTLLKRFIKEEIHINRVIIETTGLANPAPVIQTFLMDDLMASWFEIDSVCTVLDSKHILQHIDIETALEQIAFADVLIFNKVELIDKQELDGLKARIIGINPNAKMLFSSNCEIDIKEIIDIKSFELGNKLKINPQLLKNEHRHQHNDDINSFIFTDERPLNLDKINKWFSYLVQIKGESLYRYKGILHIADRKERVVFQGVHMLFSGTSDRKWKKDEAKLSKIVLIGKNLNKLELEKGFEYCVAAQR